MRLQGKSLLGLFLAGFFVFGCAAVEAAPSMTITSPTSGTSAVVGDSVYFSGTALDDSGNPLPGSSLIWGDETVGPFGTGLSMWHTFASTGERSILLSATDANGTTNTTSIRLTIVPAPPPTITVAAPSDGTQFYSRQPVSYSAWAVDSRDGWMAASSIRWFTDRQGFLGTGNPLLTTAPAEVGGSVLTVRVTNSRGSTAETTRALTILDGNQLAQPRVGITRPWPWSRQFEGVPLVLEGYGLDALNFALSGRDLSWNVDGGPSIGSGTTLATSAVAGTHDFSLRGTDAWGRTVATTVTVAVEAASSIPAPSLTIYRPAPALTYYETVPLSLYGWADDYLDGRLPDSALSWATTTGTVLASAVSQTSTVLPAGEWGIQLTATNSHGKSATQTATIQVRPLSQVPPPTVWMATVGWGSRLNVGQQLTLVAYATDIAEGQLPSSRISWASDAFTPAVTGNGITVVVTGPPGYHVVGARAVTSRGTTGIATAQVCVLDPASTASPRIAILSPIDGARLVYGQTVNLRATGFSDLDGDLGWWNTHWEDGAGTNLGAGLLASYTPMQVTSSFVIRVLAHDSANRLSVATCTVSILPPTPQLNVHQPSPGQSVVKGDSLVLYAHGWDPHDGSLPDSGMVWSSNRSGRLGSGIYMTVTTLPLGPHVLSVTGTNSFGTSGVTTIAIEIVPAPPPSLTIGTPGDGATFYTRQSISYWAWAVDSRDGWMPAESLRWSTDRQGFVGAGNPLVTTAPAEVGPAVVTLVATNSRGTTAQATRQITLVDGADLGPPRVWISRPWPWYRYFETVPIVLEGGGSDALNFPLAAQNLSWSQDGNSTVGSGTRVTTSPAAGTHSYSLRATDAWGRTVATTVTIQVEDAAHIPAPTVYVTRPQPSWTYYETVPISLIGAADDFLDGSLQDAALMWTTTAGTVIGVGASPGSTLLNPGQWSLRLTAVNSHGKSTTQTVTIQVLPLSQAPPPSIWAASPTLGWRLSVGQPLSLIAYATDVIEGQVPSGRLRWASDGFTPASTSNNVTATVTGPPGVHGVEVQASTSRGVTGRLTFPVAVVDPASTAPPRVEIVFPARGAILSYGQQITMRAQGFSDSDGELSWWSVRWLDGAGRELGAGLSQSWTPMEITTGLVLRAVAHDSANRTSEASLTVSVLPPVPQATIWSPGTGSTVQAADSVALQGGGYDVLDGQLPEPALRWSSDRDGYLGTGSYVDMRTLSDGTHRLTLTVTSSHGMTAAATSILTVSPRPAPVVEIRAPAGNTRPLAGRSMVFEAVVTNLSAQDPLTQTFVWNSDRQGSLGEGASVVTSFASPGEQVISVVARNSRGQSGIATLALPVSGLLRVDRVLAGNPQRVLTSWESGWTTSPAPALWTDRGLRFAVYNATGQTLSATLSHATTGEALVTGSEVFDLQGQSLGSFPATTGQGRFLASATLPAEPRATVHMVWFRAGVDPATQSDLAELGYELSTDPGNRAVTGGFSVARTWMATIQVAILQPPPGAQFALGVPVAAIGTASAAGEVLSSESLRWTVDGTISAGVGASVAITALGTGAHQLELSAVDRQGGQASARTTFSVVDTSQPPGPSTTPPQVVSALQVQITTPSAGFNRMHFGEVVTFHAQVTESSTGLTTAATLEWSSTPASVAGTGPSVIVSGLPVGAYLLRALATDSRSRQAEATRALTVVPDYVPSVSITAPTSGTTVPLGEIVTLQGDAVDPEEGPLPPASLEWRSSLQGALSTGTTVLTSGLQLGDHVISLIGRNSRGRAGNASITVTVASTPWVGASIESPQDETVVEHGTTVHFMGRATDKSLGAIGGSALLWSSRLDGPLGTGMSVVTTTLSVGRHQIDLRANGSRGYSAVATLAITVQPRACPFIELPRDGDLYLDSDQVILQAKGGSLGTTAVAATWALSWQLDGANLLSRASAIVTSSPFVGSHIALLSAESGEGTACTSSAAFSIVSSSTPLFLTSVERLAPATSSMARTIWQSNDSRDPDPAFQSDRAIRFHVVNRSGHRISTRFSSPTTSLGFVERCELTDPQGQATGECTPAPLGLLVSVEATIPATVTSATETIWLKRRSAWSDSLIVRGAIFELRSPLGHELRRYEGFSVLGREPSTPTISIVAPVAGMNYYPTLDLARHTPVGEPHPVFVFDHRLFLRVF